MDDQMGYWMAPHGKEHETVEPVANGPVPSMSSTKHMRNRGTLTIMLAISTTGTDSPAHSL